MSDCAGELLAEMEKAKRGPDARGQGSQRATSDGKTLAEHGISRDQSSRWQKLARVPQPRSSRCGIAGGSASESAVKTGAADTELASNFSDAAPLVLEQRLSGLELLIVHNRTAAAVTAASPGRGKTGAPSQDAEETRPGRWVAPRFAAIDRR